MRGGKHARGITKTRVTPTVSVDTAAIQALQKAIKRNSPQPRKCTFGTVGDMVGGIMEVCRAAQGCRHIFQARVALADAAFSVFSIVKDYHGNHSLWAGDLLQALRREGVSDSDIKDVSTEGPRFDISVCEGVTVRVEEISVGEYWDKGIPNILGRAGQESGIIARHFVTKTVVVEVDGDMNPIRGTQRDVPGDRTTSTCYGPDGREIHEDDLWAVSFSVSFEG